MPASYSFRQLQRADWSATVARSCRGGAAADVPPLRPVAGRPQRWQRDVQSLAENIAWQGYYRAAPGGYAGVIGRARYSVASCGVPPGAAVYDFATYAIRTSIDWGVAREGQYLRLHLAEDGGMYVPQLRSIFIGADPGDGTARPLNAKEQALKEHELLHAAQHASGMPMHTGHDCPVALTSEDVPDWHRAYWLCWYEIDARLATIKRMFARRHPGRDVASPEDARDAWCWFMQCGGAMTGAEAIAEKDVRVWRALADDFDVLRNLFFRRMPQLV